MGVLNVTPDSFSDGGRYLDLDARRRPRARDCARPAPTSSTSAASPPARAPHRVDAAEELRPGAAGDRASSSPTGVPVSVDTTRAAVAEAALEAGAHGRQRRLRRPGRPGDGPRWSRDAGCPWILMHWRGHSDRHGRARRLRRRGRARCGAELVARVDAAVLAGVDPGRIVLDPGLGLRQDRRAQLGAAARGWTCCWRSGSRCWSAPPASGSSAQLLAGADGTPRPADGPRGGHGRDHRAGRARRARGACGCTRSRRPWTPSRWRGAAAGRVAGPGQAPERVVTG